MINVKTGNELGAGTDAEVFIELYGVNGTKSDKIFLRNKSDNFERGQVNSLKKYFIACS